MASLGMNGPYNLTDEKINEVVTKSSPGNYGLGYLKDAKTFIIQYVGRSDSDVNNRLHSWLGKGYKQFKFSYASSPKAAFEKECENFHDFGGSESLDNSVHPDRPDGSNWKCPRCGVLG